MGREHRHDWTSMSDHHGRGAKRGWGHPWVGEPMRGETHGWWDIHLWWWGHPWVESTVRTGPP